MSSRDRADIRPGEDLYDRIDRLVDEDPIALRDLAWKLLAERDANATEHNAARAEVDTAEARGYRKAIEALTTGAAERVMDEAHDVTCGGARWHQCTDPRPDEVYLPALIRFLESEAS